MAKLFTERRDKLAHTISLLENKIPQMTNFLCRDDEVFQNTWSLARCV